MSSKSRTKSQARKDRAALKRLQKSGTYSGKIDLRKAPSKYQLKKIAELKQAAKPMPPKSRVPGAKITRKRMTEKEVRNITPATKQSRLTTYALPFRRKGQPNEWRRFTLKQLTQFLNEYKEDEEERAEWRRYAVKETWSFENKSKRDEFKTDTDLYFSGRRIDAPNVAGFAKTKGRNKHNKKEKR